MVNSRLTALQHEILETFFQREKRFFLTGGAALAGFYLGHRETHDLDLFTVADALADGVALIDEIARQAGGSVESIQTTPDFRRLLVRRGSEAVLVDLVHERVPQLISEKALIKGILIDLPEEILANKLCALLSRSEVRDLVDVRALEQAGYQIEDSIAAAAKKDAGLTPAQLGWVLGQMRLGADAGTNADVSVDELRDYLAGLVVRLGRLAFPGN